MGAAPSVLLDVRDNDNSSSLQSSALEPPPFSLPIGLLKAGSLPEHGLSNSTNFGDLASRILAGKEHTFITGGAGVGKTTLLCALRVIHKARGGKDASISVVAPSGLAALSDGGATCHTFLGLRPKDVVYSRDSLTEAVRLVQTGAVGAAAVSRIVAMDVFCIDEVSMVSGIFFALMMAIIQLSVDGRAEVCRRSSPSEISSSSHLCGRGTSP